MNSFYAKKIIFNITQFDLDRMNEMRGKRGQSQSEYIRSAIRMHVAEHKIEELSRGEVGTYARPRAPDGLR